MEQIYALGITCIEFVQEWFSGSEWYFEIVNNLSNPHHLTEILFPLITVVDSVFGAQLLLCMAFGGWLTSLLKWCLQEDRPYWWVRETSYYNTLDRPELRQTLQTCETGPGSPSGHSGAAATIILLILMWTKHVMHDRQCYVFWWKYVMYPMSVFAMGSVVLSRMYIATHFPHQCLIGALLGSFLAPALCIYLSDPFVWRYGAHAKMNPRKVMSWHVLGSAATVIISVLAYFSLVLAGQDPQWTVRMAFRHCESPEQIHVSTTPVFSLVQCTGSLLGLALCVTPAIAEYRHYTKNRSLIMSAIATALTVFTFRYTLDNICKTNTFRFYATHFVASALKPMMLLRVVPAFAMWPFTAPKNKTE
ncbi:unnamed protein product [Arctia plantaginis]|uniref:glucose-6-phosphatase n=1 Tax=Arctia plantaginis TaxID=874455 RepID=A0A8S1AAS8_ARCPL|nr:unnamed protein product [Arctia plantaginis]